MAKYVFIALLTLVAVAAADVPHLLNVQGLLTDAEDEPLPDQSYSVVFTIYGVETGGSALWTETRSIATLGGLFTIYLGQSNPLPLSLFENQNLWLGLAVEGEAEMTPRQRLSTAPYVFRACSADSAGFAFALADDAVGSEQIVDGSIELADLGQNGATTDQVLKWDGGAWTAADDETGAGSGGGWVDDGGVVRLADNGDHVGIGNSTPSELLSVGNDLTTFSGNLITVGDADPEEYAGISFGQDADNRGWMVYDNERDYIYWGTKEDGSFPDYAMYMKNGGLIIGDRPTSGSYCLYIDCTVPGKERENGVHCTIRGTPAYQTNGAVFAAYGGAINYGVQGLVYSTHDGDIGVMGVCGQSNVDYGVYSYGNFHATGSSTYATSGYRIDHPQDPASMYLQHAAVSSSERKNIYDGTVTTDSNGDAFIELPSYFASLNADYRYQLTVVGTFAQAIIKEKIKNNQFSIKTDEPHVEVCWQVTGVRQDAMAKSTPLNVEAAKDVEEQGLYQNPEVYGLDSKMAVDYKRINMPQEEQQGK